MRILFNLVALTIIILVAYVATLNSKIVVDFIVWGTQGVNANSVHISLAILILAVFVTGMISGVIWFSSHYFSAQGKLKEYKRKLEKHSVSVENESSKVSVLEAKIEVLEKALKSALEKND